MTLQTTSGFARLYFDEDADARLAAGLSARGYDVETTVEAGLRSASDEMQLAYAAGQTRALVTHNVKHFPGIHAEWLGSDRSHSGIVVLIGQSAVSAWLRRMETLLKRFPPEQIRNQLFFLGAQFDD